MDLEEEMSDRLPRLSVTGCNAFQINTERLFQSSKDNPCLWISFVELAVSPYSDDSGP